MKRYICFILVLCSNLLAAADEKPNILFIFADDWGWGDLSCHGHPYVKTPHIDRLAKEGTDFHRFTVASGVCSPSRTAVMTGHFPARYNIDGHFVWVKKRNGSESHRLADVIRGSTVGLASNNNLAETDVSGSISSFNKG